MDIQRGNIIVMDRRRGTLRAGQGLLQGLKVVWDHWVGSFRKNDNFSQIHGTFTIEYPDERMKLPQAYRNMPVLLYDDETGQELCTACYQCARACPPEVIHITQAKDPNTGKMVPASLEFIIEYDACMSCGLCAEACPFDAIKMDHFYELSTDNRMGLMQRKADLNRPVSYYTSIAPDLWDEVKEGAMKKLQGSIKRRPDVIGIAGHLSEKIAARRRQLAAEAAASPPAPVAAAPAAPAGKLSPEEKAAKLAAMRAAKAGGAEPAAEAPAPAAELSPADAKAAKLAAIKAANAAKKAAESPAAEVPAAPLDEKAAKLAAIRAANAAKAAAEAPAAPLDEKAAKLAAIRAANAAKKKSE
ncbi:4Fe-4S binding protein [Candidatus Oscillochloris fontis]|uniref:4Fe-4S binding protein n=1 Tax=Candidatus Oscillochloris fontis TaxID=2496868 RepID=UPI00101DAE25|nr:4Fe-4S binding protein [Candidatus Oscillochloris fontis]